ncbi:MAG: N-acetylglucosamine-6-phosphate deacetylase [Chloroflexi bacterium]|nr:N-acetylglucosamine-6-phosphate deacetylase [Chloroflexota bacterium]
MKDESGKMRDNGHRSSVNGRFALVNGRIVLPDEITQGKAVVIERDKIVAVTDVGALGAEIEKIDVGGRYITPGLIDIHTHGALGHTFNEPTADAFATICVENARRGVTSLVATLATAPIPDLVACLNFARAWMRAPRAGSRVLGTHLESPYISLAQKGALDPGNIRMPDDGSVDALLEHSDVIKIFALAPELPGALPLVEKLARLGIVPAAGHSSAKDDDVLAAMRVGLRHVTHIWSAMSSTIREGPWRKPGLLETALTYDGLTVEMICDNKHLPPTLLKLGYKCIGAERLCVISDAMNGAGLPEGSRFKMGALEYDVRDGVGMMLDRSAFAGSTTLLNEMIPILTNVVGVPIPQAIRMLTRTPARVIGVDARVGSIAPHKDADLAIFNDAWRAWRVMIGGAWIHTEDRIQKAEG